MFSLSWRGRALSRKIKRQEAEKSGCIQKHKLAFTLAEVLITLGIIGVVAALVMPGFIQDSKKRQTSARLKRFNSIMSQAITRSINENGSFDDIVWLNDSEFDLESFFNTYLAQYLSYRVAKKNSPGEFDVELSDGTTFKIWKSSACVELYFDVNGKKNPNTMGKDQYNFMMCDKAHNSGWSDGRAWGSYRISAHKNNRAILHTYCTSNARYCSALLEYDNWEFKEDYPYKL